MVKDKERARLRIEIQDPDFAAGPGPLGFYMVGIKVLLDGSTPAYILASECLVSISVTGEVPAKIRIHPSIHIPQIISPMPGLVESSSLILAEPSGMDLGGVTDSIIQLIRENSRYLWCEGYIRYKDVFGGEWRLNIKRRWAYFCRTGSYEWAVFRRKLGDIRRAGVQCRT